MSGMLEKYKSLKNVFNRARANELHLRLGRLSQAELAKMEVGSPTTVVPGGRVFLLHEDGEEPFVMELVMGPDDSVTNLYGPHPIFNSRQDYINARQELIDLLNDFRNAGVFGAEIDRCPLRQRPVNVRELGMRQLLELVLREVKARTQ